MGKLERDIVGTEAFRFYKDSMPEWFVDKLATRDIILRNCSHDGYKNGQAYCEVKTLQGVVRCNLGDWIIKKASDELYVAKESLPEDLYDSADGKGKEGSQEYSAMIGEDDDRQMKFNLDSDGNLHL